MNHSPERALYEYPWVKPTERITMGEALVRMTNHIIDNSKVNWCSTKIIYKTHKDLQ
jgi:hypothetical protein